MKKRDVGILIISMSVHSSKFQNLENISASNFPITILNLI